MRVTLKVLLAAAVVLLAYMCYRSIMEPIEFDKERTARESAIEKRLIDIRTAQIEYKNRNGRHAGSFEELAKFLNESKLPFVIKEGVLTAGEGADRKESRRDRTPCPPDRQQ